MSQWQLQYCDNVDCKSKNKIIQTVENITHEHRSHLPVFLFFNDIRDDLLKENHPLKDAKDQKEESIYLMIDLQIVNLIKAFTLVANDIKQQLRNFVSSQIFSLNDLQQLYTAIIDKKDAKIEEYQHLVPKLLICKQAMQNQDGEGKRVQKKVNDIFKLLNVKLQALKTIDFTQTKDPLLVPKWSATYKLEDAKINGALATGVESFWFSRMTMQLIEPTFSTSEVMKVKIKVIKLETMYLSLCDLNIAQFRRPTWDYRTNFGDGTYSHRENGGIYPHHQTPSQTNGQALGFTFKQGDILELHWNGPKRQFITYRPSTQDKYIQNVQFNENAVLYFGVQMWGGNAVELI